MKQQLDQYHVGHFNNEAKGLACQGNGILFGPFLQNVFLDDFNKGLVFFAEAPINVDVATQLQKRTNLRYHNRGRKYAFSMLDRLL